MLPALHSFIILQSKINIFHKHTPSFHAPLIKPTGILYRIIFVHVCFSLEGKYWVSFIFIFYSLFHSHHIVKVQVELNYPLILIPVLYFEGRNKCLSSIEDFVNILLTLANLKMKMSVITYCINFKLMTGREVSTINPQ